MDKQSVVFQALRASAGGLLFSLLLSAVIGLGLALNLAPVKAVERVGIDWGMKSYTAMALPIESEPRSGSAVEYVFLDVTPDVCRLFRRPQDPACGAGAAINADLVVAFAAFARESEVAVAIIDAELPSDLGDVSKIKAALGFGRSAPDEGPLFILAAPCRGMVEGLRTAEICDWRLWGGPAPARRVRFASFMTATDPEARDGIIRHFPAVTMTRGANASEIAWLPSAPFLAAVQARRAAARAVDCRYYGLGCSGSSDVRQEDPAALRDRSRVFFTLPEVPPSESSDDLRYAGLYERYEDFATVEPRALTSSSHFRGSTVVLGSSQATSLDSHLTPIGEMSGAEVLLNATRAFRSAAPMKVIRAEQPLSERLRFYAGAFASKAGGAVLGTILLFPVWLLIYRLVQLRGKQDVFWRRLWINGLVVLAFLTGLAGLVVLEVGMNLVELSSARGGQAVDMVTPLVALGLEGFAEAAKTVSGLLERVAHHVLLNLAIVLKIASAAAATTWARGQRWFGGFGVRWRSVWRWRPRFMAPAKRASSALSAKSVRSRVDSARKPSK